jgi:hypothetical protein
LILGLVLFDRHDSKTIWILLWGQGTRPAGASDPQNLCLALVLIGIVTVAIGVTMLVA